MRLDDEQIERYSRQLILQEVGPRGQERLLAARVAVVGTDGAAERVVAHLAAAGVGTIVAAPALRGAIDPAQPDCAFTALGDAADAVDAVVVCAPAIAAATDALRAWRSGAITRLWIADGYAGGTPPCPRCALVGREPRAVPPPLAALRDACLGTIVATEVVKALLAIGTGLSGRVIAYDPTSAAIENAAAAARADCDCG